MKRTISRLLLLLAVGSCLLMRSSAGAADQPAATTAQKPSAAPEQMSIEEQIELAIEDDSPDLDQRQKFLFGRLAKVDALLNAIEGRQFSNHLAQNKQKAITSRAKESVVRQYANGGGPIRWTKFYGRTIDAFYHQGPTSATVVMDRYGNVGARVSQGSPTKKERPKQFDYIEKAQYKLQDDAAQEIKSLGSKMEVLDARRKDLELEQLSLWCQIAFREVQRRDLTQKAFYRFEPMASESTTDSQKQVEAMRVAVILMSRVLDVIEKSDGNQAQDLHRIAGIVKGARVYMTDTWMRQGVLDNTVTNDKLDTSTPRGRFIRLTRLLEDLGANVDDSFARSMVIANARAEVSKLDEKNQTWDQFTKSLTGFSFILLQMDESAVTLAQEWHVKPNLDAPLIVEVESARRVGGGDKPAARTPQPVPLESSSAFDLANLREIKIKTGRGNAGKGKKRGKQKGADSWASHAVLHKDGVVQVKRGDGKTTVLKLDGDTLVWTKPKGGDMRIDVERRRTNEGEEVEFNFAK